MSGSNGLVTSISAAGFDETCRRLESALQRRGVTVFARIDHGAGARDAGMELRPTWLIIFGNPRGGTPLMQAAQTVGIDLPLKMLVWQDADDATRISYSDPAWIAARHNATAAAQTIAGMQTLLSDLAREAGQTP